MGGNGWAVDLAQEASRLARGIKSNTRKRTLECVWPPLNKLNSLAMNGRRVGVLELRVVELIGIRN